MKVGYSKTYPILVSGQWEKIWIEDEMTGTEDEVKKRLYDLKRNVENFHYESNKAAEKQKEAERPPSLNDVVSIINEIRHQPTVENLMEYELIANTDQDIKEAYEKRLDLFTKATINQNEQH